MAYVMDQNFEIEKGYMMTVHSYTNDQRLLDNAHKDLRRARSAGLSMIPTTTGAASAIEKILPSLKNKLQGLSIRVPTANVSLVELVVFCKKNITALSVQQAFEDFEKNSSILSIERQPLVSNDFIGSPYSVVMDWALTEVNQNSARLFGWYDNEAGYCQRLLDVISMIDQKGF